MAEADPTQIGRVQHVLGSRVTVALNAELAGIAPIYRGRLQPIGQIGSLVRIPQGMVDLIGSVMLVGIAELSGPLPPADTVQIGERWLQVQLVGEIHHGAGTFQRGISSYPSLDDAVHFTTPEQLTSLFPPPSEEHLQLGCLSASEDVPVCLDAQKLVIRHSAVVGSTGSGKTSAVASLLQSFVEGGWKAANLIVIDPHGEYASAFGELAAVRSVLTTDADAKLEVPYWALSASEAMRIFTGTNVGGGAMKRFSELVASARQKFAHDAPWLDLDPAAVTADTPIPYDIKEVWFLLDYENRETRDVKGDKTSAKISQPGNAQSLTPTQFDPWGPAGSPPHQAPLFGSYGRAPELLRLGLLDPRLAFFLTPSADASDADALGGVINDWLGNLKPISVLDFSGVPPEAADAAIGVVLDLLFEVAVRSGTDGQGIGRPHPALIVLEEAHRYLSDSASEMARSAANRIAREGRKYGIGLMLVTQRPSELPDTALSQCGTLIALRLTNSSDQGKIRAALPDAVTGLADVLPSLRTGEAVVSGEATILPARVLIRHPHPEPFAHDPELTSWRSEPTPHDFTTALAEWRGTYEVTP